VSRTSKSEGQVLLPDGSISFYFRGESYPPFEALTDDEVDVLWDVRFDLRHETLARFREGLK
jgi:hypothetical protein